MTTKTKSPRKSARKSTKTRGLGAVKSAHPAKSAVIKSARAGKSGAAGPAQATRVPRCKGRKAAPKRSTNGHFGKAVEGCVTTLDGWRKECAAKLGHLIHDRSAKAGRSKKGPRRARKHHGAPEWFKSGARQVGLGLVRGVELASPRKLLGRKGKKMRRMQFNRLAKFCKKELKDLVAMAARLNELANQPPHRAKRRTK